MKHVKLLLSVSLLAFGCSLVPESVSATTLERGNFSEFRADRQKARKERKERRQQRQRSQESRSGGGFFDSLFRFQRRRWFDDNGPNLRGIAAPRKPEFYTYKVSARTALKDSKLRGDVSEAAYSRWILDTLRSGSAAEVRVEPAEKKAILAFYKARNFEPLWIGAYGLNVRALRLIDALSKAYADGLTVSSYIPLSISAFSEINEDLLEDPEAVADLEIGLTASALTFVRHASGGQVSPNKIGRSYDLKPQLVAPATALKELASSLHPEEFLDSLHPTHPLYVRLKKLLAKERGTGDEEVLAQIPEGGLIRIGAEDDRVPLIRARLRKLGFLADGGETGDDEPSNELGYDLNADTAVQTVNAIATGDRNYVYDAELARAVREFQGSKRLSRDGIIGRRTVAALNGQSAGKISDKLEINMERFRWLPRSLGRKHIIVNQAAYQAQMIDNGRKIHQMRVIVGKPRHPTPLFSDEMETVVFNPYWNVPRSITSNEYLPRLMNDPGYLDRRGFQVIDRRGKQVSSYSIDWWNYDGRTLPYDVRQPPGRGNALGQIKFLFPNKHAVYMHDTPKRNLFSNRNRAYSHGCVRVQNPRKFAEMVLGWSASKVSSAVEAGQNRPVTLPRKIPVHMTYFTLWPDDSGNLVTRSDVYRRDKALKKALKLTKTALLR